MEFKVYYKAQKKNIEKGVSCWDFGSNKVYNSDKIRSWVSEIQKSVKK